jgi:hypothetical protein
MPMEALFTLIVFGSLGLVLFALLLLGRSPRSIGQLTGRADERRLGTQAMIEGGDIDEALEAQNRARRARGIDELTEEEIRARANERQRRSIEQAKRHAGAS